LSIDDTHKIALLVACFSPAIAQDLSLVANETMLKILKDKKSLIPSYRGIRLMILHLNYRTGNGTSISFNQENIVSRLN